MRKPCHFPEVHFDVVDGRLILSCSTEAVAVCDDCDDLHVHILAVASAENVRALGAGLIHLAGHLADPGGGRHDH